MWRGSFLCYFIMNLTGLERLYTRLSFSEQQYHLDPLTVYLQINLLQLQKLVHSFEK